MIRRTIVAGFLLPFLALGVAAPALSQQADTPVMRYELKAPILFSSPSGGGGDDGEGPPPIDPQSPEPVVVYSASNAVPAGAPAEIAPSSIDPDGVVTSWRFATGSSVPPGLSINGASGLVTGTPTQPGTFSGIVVEGVNASNAVQVVSSPFSISVTSPAIAVAVADGTFHSDAVSFPVGVTGGYAPHLSVSWTPNTPALAYDAGTGLVGMTQASVPTGSYGVQASATDGYSSGSDTATITVVPPMTLSVPASSYAMLTNASSNYSVVPTPQDAIGAITWSATNIPAGMQQNPTTGAVYGIPTTPNTYALTITATDSTGATRTAATTITVTTPVLYPSVVKVVGMTGTAGSGSVNINISQYQDGDLVLAVVEAAGNQYPSFPSGWTEIISFDGGVSNEASSIKVAYRRMSGTYTVQQIASPGDHIAVQSYVIRGALATGNPVGNPQTNTLTTSTSGSITGVTSTDKGLVFAIAARGNDAAGSFFNWTGASYLGNLVEQSDAGHTNGHGGGFSVMTAEVDPSTAPGPWTIGYTTTQSLSHRATAFVIKSGL